MLEHAWDVNRAHIVAKVHAIPHVIPVAIKVAKMTVANHAVVVVLMNVRDAQKHAPDVVANALDNAMAHAHKIARIVVMTRAKKVAMTLALTCAQTSVAICAFLVALQHVWTAVRQHVLTHVTHRALPSVTARRSRVQILQ